MGVWLVTGSSRGLGLAITKAAVAAGHSVVATARRPVEIEGARPYELDVTDPAQANAAVAFAVKEFGRVDVLVNNAGYIHANSVEDMDPTEWRKQIEVDLFGVYNLVYAVLPVMHAQRDGWICSVSSIGGRRATSGLSAYQAAKHAVGGFSEVLAGEVAPLGIRVTCVEPAGMRTDMFSASMLGDVKPDYVATVKDRVTGFFGNPANAHINIDRFAQLLLRLAKEPAPPVRMLIGRDAVRGAAVAAQARADEDARWRELAESVDD